MQWKKRSLPLLVSVVAAAGLLRWSSQWGPETRPTAVSGGTLLFLDGIPHDRAEFEDFVGNRLPFRSRLP